jgi:hypothetical protein
MDSHCHHSSQFQAICRKGGSEPCDIFRMITLSNLIPLLSRLNHVSGIFLMANSLTVINGQWTCLIIHQTWSVLIQHCRKSLGHVPAYSFLLGDFNQNPFPISIFNGDCQMNPMEGKSIFLSRIFDPSERLRQGKFVLWPPPRVVKFTCKIWLFPLSQFIHHPRSRLRHRPPFGGRVLPGPSNHRSHPLRNGVCSVFGHLRATAEESFVVDSPVWHVYVLKGSSEQRDFPNSDYRWATGRCDFRASLKVERAIAHGSWTDFSIGGSISHHCCETGTASERRRPGNNCCWSSTLNTWSTEFKKWSFVR